MQDAPDDRPAWTDSDGFARPRVWLIFFAFLVTLTAVALVANALGRPL
jgi:hypothetical protein